MNSKLEGEANKKQDTQSNNRIQVKIEHGKGRHGDIKSRSKKQL